MTDKEKSAREMFEEQDYKYIDGFFLNQRAYSYYYVRKDGFGVGFDTTNNAISFNNTLEKLGNVHISLDLYRGINKQIEELGWE